MELKSNENYDSLIAYFVLIVPLWNWNDADYNSVGIDPQF